MMGKCPYAKKNKFGRLECSVILQDNGASSNNKDGGEVKSPLCPFQRYCSQKSEWENTNNISTCGRRKSANVRRD